MSAPSTVDQGGNLGQQPLTTDTKLEDNVEIYEKETAVANGVELCLPEGCGLPVAEGGGVLSPLSGAYLLIVLSEPMSEQHKSKMIQKLRQGRIISFLT